MLTVSSLGILSKYLRVKASKQLLGTGEHFSIVSHGRKVGRQQEELSGSMTKVFLLKNTSHRSMYWLSNKAASNAKDILVSALGNMNYPTISQLDQSKNSYVSCICLISTGCFIFNGKINSINYQIYYITYLKKITFCIKGKD